MTADPAFQEPAGSKHDYDQIVIALSPIKISLSLDGKPAKATGPVATCSSSAVAWRT